MNPWVSVVRDGEEMDVKFDDIRAGDYVVMLDVMADDDAHMSGDASYDGLLFFDTSGEGWFPEDVLE